VDREEALKLLRGGPEGVARWNEYRARGGKIPIIAGANLADADLTGAVLKRAVLDGAVLDGAVLDRASLDHASFEGASLVHASLAQASAFRIRLDGALLDRAWLIGASLVGASLVRARLNGATLDWAVLDGALLRSASLVGTRLIDATLDRVTLVDATLDGAMLDGATFYRATLHGADLSYATCGSTLFADIDLSRVDGLELIRHERHSCISTDTFVRSRGKIPESFLRGCGLTPWEVLTVNHYKTGLTPHKLAELQYRIFDSWTKRLKLINGCFISYSWKDTRFVDKLRDRLIVEGVNAWLDRHDMVAGPIQDQVWKAIQVHHVVIIVLSKDSVNSDWVENELDMARTKERVEKRAVLCPLALDDEWKEVVTAKDKPGHSNRALWLTLTTKLIVDFAGWDTDAFDAAFTKLIRGLKTYYAPSDPPAAPGADASSP
jgi:uncharacterized protein YjbI with pentapeptide repeats